MLGRPASSTDTLKENSTKLNQYVYSPYNNNAWEEFVFTAHTMRMFVGTNFCGLSVHRLLNSRI